MYNLRPRSKDKSKYPNNQKDVLMASRSKSISRDMNIDYLSQKLATNKIFTLKKIEQLTSEKFR